ncbi:U3 small nucleolar RNA interacting protein 2 [Aphelenchoides besseyi]|nr:U3 small nucleolar RNA interacting protein 2 [Aphelenchoides besseyi]KAI6193988.1 U3 small nucleolar RNA interacting protein 2 [Aphelenchoides besseyi]
MTFFKRGASKKKGAVAKKKSKKSADLPTKRQKKPTDDVEISSDSDAISDNVDELSDDEVFEDAQAKSFREAKRVLADLKKGDDGREDEGEELDEDLNAISHRLKLDAVQQTTKSHRRIADKVVINDDVLANYRAHRFSPVCVALSKDCHDLKLNKKVGSITHVKGSKNSHVGPVRAVAISGDDRYLASGGDDKIVRIWSLETLNHVKNFAGHRAPITSLVFRQDSNDLYSGSMDKSIRSWNLDQMGFVEIMFGHSEPISQLDMLSKQRLLSGGSSDRTLHVFKIEQSSQLVFNGLNDCISVDTVAMINDDHYISGQMNGSLYIWSVSKKKPVCVVQNAHGLHEDGQSRWICSVASLPYSDLVASGSSDGKFKLWKVSENYKAMVPVCECDIDGFINDIRFGADGQTIALAVGQEHRMGRWFTCQEARNSIVVLSLRSIAETRQLTDGTDESMDDAT